MNELGFEKDIEQCLAVLKSGGIILYPTDTVWGIGCDATNPNAVEKIFKLKQRSDQKSLIVLVAEERDVIQHVASPDLALFDHLKTLTRPTTVIYDSAIGLADNLLAPDGSIGIRICNDVFCKHLIKRFRKPIVSTSANISGQATPETFADISVDIVTGVDYTVKYRQQDTKKNAPSSIIRWENGKVTTLR